MQETVNNLSREYLEERNSKAQSSPYINLWEGAREEMKNWIDDKVLERYVEPLYICGSMNGSYIIYASHDSWAVKRERDYK